MALPLKIEHRIGVQCPGSVIWDLVSDINGWSTWNPLYPKAKGVLGFGSVLELEVALPGEATRAIKPKMREWTPGEQIIWDLQMMGGLIRSTRFIEIETLDNGNCIFSNGEFFEGPAMRLIGKKTQKAIKAGFRAFGETVRDRAEADWKAQQPAAT
jgi:hypothetical protein